MGNQRSRQTDGSTLVDAARGWANQHIHLTMQPTRPSLADAMRITDGLRYPAGAKFDGGSAHRRAIPPEADRGLVSTMGPNGRFYANAVGTTVGVVSAGGNGSRLASAVHGWALKLVDKNDFLRNCSRPTLGY